MIMMRMKKSNESLSGLCSVAAPRKKKKRKPYIRGREGAYTNEDSEGIHKLGYAEI